MCTNREMQFASNMNHLAVMLVFAVLAEVAAAQYRAVEHREINEGEIAVTEPGFLAEEGKTYVLTKDISSPGIAVMLAKNVTLDLNGYTVTYTAGNYEHVPNFSFEEGLKDWDVSKAPGAKVQNMPMVRPLVGDKVCVLPKDQEIASKYINLPVADRAYFAMAIVAEDKMQVQVRLENEKDGEVTCEYFVGGGKRDGVPITANSNLGGGGVIGLFHGKPAGRYRIVVKAVNRDAIIDCVDIRPAMDVGVGIMEKVRPYGYHRGLADGELPGFFEYSSDKAKMSTRPISGVPISNEGTITVKNGVIKSGFRAVQSNGLVNSSSGTKLVIDHVRFEAAGINTNGLRSDGPVEMSNSRFEIDTPFIINRHVHDMAAVIRGKSASEIKNCEFIGGQGNLAIGGDNSLVHDNLFVNSQTVTNHYSIGADGSGLKIYNNRIEPKIGSGIYIYRNKNCEVYDNEITITTAPPNNEYGQTDYSTNAIRISDYNAAEGSDRGCSGNKVYRNKIKLIGKSYPGADPNYLGMTYGVFMSVGGGQNYVFDNEIIVEDKRSHSDKGETIALYVGGSNNGGEFYGNKVTSNVPFFWIANRYGSANNVLVYNNTLLKAPGAGRFPAVRMGYYRSDATNTSFFSNKVEGMALDFEIGGSNKTSTALVGWTLKVETTPGAEVTAMAGDAAAVKATADDKGVAVLRLAQYKIAADNKKTEFPEYTVKAGNKVLKVKMSEDRTISLK